MTLTFVRLETIVRRAPLGLRFEDIARRAPVHDGLRIEAWPLGTRINGPGIPAMRSRMSGNYGYRSLPGLRDYERNQAPATDWCPTPGDTNANYAVRVEDTWGRFLPQVLRLCLPKETVLEVPLFSSPARALVPGMVVIRGEARRRVPDSPAAWAVLTITIDNDKSYITVADERGMFLFLVPYAARLAPDTPLTGPMDTYTWPIRVEAQYEPGVQELIPGLAVPHIGSLLVQGAAPILDTLVSPQPHITRSLHFGVDLVLSTAGESRLWLSV